MQPRAAAAPDSKALTHELSSDPPWPHSGVCLEVCFENPCRWVNFVSCPDIYKKKKKSITFLKAENKNPGSTSKEGFSLLQQSTSGAASPNTVSLVPLSSSCQHLVLESVSCSCLWVASFGISGVTTSGPALWCLAKGNTREPGIFWLARPNLAIIILSVNFEINWYREGEVYVLKFSTLKRKRRNENMKSCPRRSGS